jgi:hypothetical protein
LAACIKKMPVSELRLGMHLHGFDAEVFSAFVKSLGIDPTGSLVRARYVRRAHGLARA